MTNKHSGASEGGEIVQRPRWWHPGCGRPLPHLYASTRYTGTGAINSGGRVFAQTVPCRWETREEWNTRTAISRARGSHKP